MNESDRKQAIKAKLFEIAVWECMDKQEMTKNERLTTISELLMSYISKYVGDPKDFMKFLSTSILTVIARNVKSSLISGNGDNVQINKEG